MSLFSFKSRITYVFKHFTNHIFNIDRWKKNYPSLTNYFALRLAFNTQSLKGVMSMEKEPQTHEMSPQNALFPQKLISPLSVL